MTQSLFDRVARHADACGAHTALARWIPGSGIFVETSYGDLRDKAAELAALLGQLVPQPVTLPMLVGRSADSVAGMLAATALRKPFCFLNAKLRGPQIAAVLEATRAPVCAVDRLGLVALRGAGQDFPHVARTTWLLLEDEPLTGIYAEAAAALREAASVVSVHDELPPGRQLPCHDAPDLTGIGACLFTSGSTGQPKGVLVSEDDLSRRVDAEVRWFALRPDDVLLNLLPFSFDVGLNQLMTALTVGAELVLLDSWLPKDILAASAQRSVTGISGVPAIWQDMIKTGAAFDTGGRHTALRYITISGGSLSAEHLRQLPAIVPGVAVFKTYGQTEAFRATSLRPEDYLRKLDSVGRPFPGVCVYVVRDDGRLCAPGEVGEVVHTGLGLMAGYLSDGAEPAAAPRKLRPNPFRGDADPSPWAVFTGDMGYLDADGYLFLKGRGDGLVKVMGNRVYPQEVTNQIVAIPGVHDALVTSVPRPDGQTALVAFVAPAAEADLAAAGIRKALGKRLPGYMIPERILVVKEIPRTASGKPDQRRLLQECATGSVGDRV
jgi:acyl-CoA synthetase (AMP-forming)/AMP-acid ligase II